MSPNGRATPGEIARIVRGCLERGDAVEIEGLGVFRPGGRRGGFTFQPETRTKVFLAYVAEDRDAAGRLYADLLRGGLDPWLDRKKLLPGQNWPRAIEQAIAVADFFVACFSGRSTGKRGRFQSELRYALDCASMLPLEEVFFIPVRLEECRVPARITRDFQYVDLFADWDKGVRRILAVIRTQMRSRARPRPPSIRTQRGAERGHLQPEAVLPGRCAGGQLRPGSDSLR
ncbi:MAG: toll/interleukin-1 receptor domain-containing protein [Bryobacteraceae bacterium]